MSRRLLSTIVSLVVIVSALNLPGEAAPLEQYGCGFSLGFATLRSLIPSEVGTCLDSETYNDKGDNVQHTTAWHGNGGLLVWRKADNWTAFTDGSKTWINGPCGLQQRLNSERFPWEMGQPCRTPTPVAPPYEPVRPSSPFSCPPTHRIKGNANSGIYHMPGQRFYDATNPEACFATESGAVMSGYRASRV